MTKLSWQEELAFPLVAGWWLAVFQGVSSSRPYVASHPGKKNIIIIIKDYRWRRFQEKWRTWQPIFRGYLRYYADNTLMQPDIIHACSAGVSASADFSPCPNKWSLHQHSQSRQTNSAASCLHEVCLQWHTAKQTLQRMNCTAEISNTPYGSYAKDFRSHTGSWLLGCFLQNIKSQKSV